MQAVTHETVVRPRPPASARVRPRPPASANTAPSGRTVRRQVRENGVIEGGPWPCRAVVLDR